MNIYGSHARVLLPIACASLTLRYTYSNIRNVNRVVVDAASYTVAFVSKTQRGEECVSCVAAEELDGRSGSAGVGGPQEVCVVCAGRRTHLVIIMIQRPTSVVRYSMTLLL